jgi:hypothetical protein
MPKRNRPINATSPAIEQYYELLGEYRQQRVHHEGAVSTAFESLLTQLAKQKGWVFIPLLAVIGKRIVPDGTIRDANGLPRGYWEAKDTADDLDKEKLAEIPQEAFDYVLGTRSALEWIVDQYRYEEDAEGNVLSDPNDPANENYIVHLIERITTVSLETLSLIRELPDKLEFEPVLKNANA